MARPLFDSEYIYGIHEPGGERHMLAADRPGWVLFCETIGHDPNDRTGIDFTTFSSRGLGVICRLDNGYEPDGTLPHSRYYEQFARRVANFVATSRGCKICRRLNAKSCRVRVAARCPACSICSRSETIGSSLARSRRNISA